MQPAARSYWIINHDGKAATVVGWTGRDLMEQFSLIKFKVINKSHSGTSLPTTTSTPITSTIIILSKYYY